MASETSFQGVMGKLREGDSFAAADVHRRYAEELVRLAQQRLDKRYQQKFDADDVVQSAFHSFFRRHADGQFEFDGWDNLWSLLASITIRKCGRRVNFFRSAKRSVLREAANENPGGDQQSVSREPSPEHAAMLDETLQQLLAELEPHQQEVLLLKLRNCSNEEISEQIGRTERTVYRTLKLIRKRLEEIDQDAGDPQE